MMVDWLTVEMPARLPSPIHGGKVVKFKVDGETEWTSTTRMTLEGSHSSSVQVRAVSPELLEVSGNLAKFLQGHNLWGTDDPIDLMDAFLSKVQPLLWPQGMPDIDIYAGDVSRIDVTSGFILPKPSDVLAWLRAAHERGVRPYMGRGTFGGTDQSSLVYGWADKGNRAKAWQFTFYAKGVEIGRRPLPDLMMKDDKVIEWVNCLLRAECRLRTVELKRLELRLLGDWTPEKVRCVWQDKIGVIDIMSGDVLSPTECEGVRARLLDAYDAWLAGRDLRAGRKRSAWYNLKRQLRDTFGIDISVPPPKSNVVPLRRVIVAEPAQRPHWADDIDRRLRAIAA